MNILVTTQDQVNPIRGGGALRTIKVAEKLKKLGHRVEIFAPSDIQEISGIPVKQLPSLNEKYRLSSCFLFVVKQFFLIITRLSKYDIFFVHNSVAAINLIFLKPFLKGKIILDITDISMEYSLAAARTRLKKIILLPLLKLEYFICKHSDKVIAVSKAMVKWLKIKGVKEEKLCFVYDGADLKKFKKARLSKLNRRRIKIVHHGGLGRRDGAGLIWETAVKVIRKKPYVKFIFTGNDKELEKIKKRATDQGLKKNFLFPGWLSFDKLKRLLNGANIGIIGRTNILPNRLVLTLKLLEYWANKLAVVAPKLAAIQEISENGLNLLYYKPDDNDDFANKIIQVIDNPNLYKRLASCGNKQVKKFDWDKLTDEIVSIML